MESDPISRRTFMNSSAALPLAFTLGNSGDGSMPAHAHDPQELEDLRRIVKLSGDGQSQTPLEYSHALSAILAQEGVEADYYSQGGVVTELEERMAQVLGKEKAVFLATGTLANHLAVRIQAGNRTRVIVQEESHIYNDSGDCAQHLSNLNLLPLAPGGGTFTLEDVETAIRRADRGRVETGVGVISIESPIRRRLGELFDYEEMKRVTAFAREKGIATHLDGARLFMASGYTGISPAEYASHFDTVYVSMWKYFNAPAGAILAGPKDLLDDLYHPRRMFGGALPMAWPLAAVALHFVDGFEERFAAGVEAGRKLKATLNTISGLRVEEVPNGSNVFKLHIRSGDPTALRAGLFERGIRLPSPNADFRGFALGVNETLVRRPVSEMVAVFEEVMRG